jgi:hypothetical protein
MNVNGEISSRQSLVIPQEAIETANSSSKVDRISTDVLKILAKNKDKPHPILSCMGEIKQLKDRKMSWAAISTYLQKEKGICIDARLLNSRYNSFQRKEREKNLAAMSDPLFAIEGASGLEQPIDDEAYFSDASLDKILFKDPWEDVCLKNAVVGSEEESAALPLGSLGRLSFEHGIKIKEPLQELISTDAMLDLWEEHHSPHKRKAGDAFNS